MVAARREIMRREAARTNDQQRFANAAFLIVTPLGTAVLGLGTPELLGVVGVFPVAFAWLFLIGLYVVFWLWANPTQASLLRLLAENEDQEELIDEQAEAIAAFERSTTRLVTALSRLAAARTMIVGFVEAGIEDGAGLSEALGELLLPVVRKGELYFGTAGSERWNFAVYLYDRNSDSLFQVWRERAPNHPGTGISRRWGRGEGHVGKTFVDGSPIVTGDAFAADVARLVGAPGRKEKPYDASAYRSFASFPIASMGSRNETPLGVLVATSDRMHRFDRENTDILGQLADLIAMLLTLTNVDASRLFQAFAHNSVDTGVR